MWRDWSKFIKFNIHSTKYWLLSIWSRVCGGSNWQAASGWSTDSCANVSSRMSGNCRDIETLIETLYQSTTRQPANDQLTLLLLYRVGFQVTIGTLKTLNKTLSANTLHSKYLLTDCSPTINWYSDHLLAEIPIETHLTYWPRLSYLKYTRCMSRLIFLNAPEY